MVEGTVQKFLKEVTLLGQPFVKDDKQTVEQLLKARRRRCLTGFTLYVVGEGIEKKANDFAAEVAAQAPLPGQRCRWRRIAKFHPSRMPACRHKRILLKLSGEALMGDDAFGINRTTIDGIVARDRARSRDMGVRGRRRHRWRQHLPRRGRRPLGMDRATADYMGMLATVMNALRWQTPCASERHDRRVCMSAICDRAGRRALHPPKAHPRIWRRARWSIFAAGTGNPFFTTDTAAALRGAGDRRADRAQGDQGRWRLHRRPEAATPAATRYATHQLRRAPSPATCR
jgi:uridylate kinase